MPNNDPMITPAGTNQLPSVTSVYSDAGMQQQQQPKKPNKFLQVLGGIAGGALNLVAPGVGSMVGNLIGGSSGSNGGAYGALMEQKQQFEEMQKYTQAANMQNQQQQQEMMNNQQKQSMQMLNIQQRVSMQAQEFTTVSNLLKTRHDSEMTAVNNIKS